MTATAVMSAPTFRGAPAHYGLGGNTVSHILQRNGPFLPELACMEGVVIELLEANLGTWQFSLNGGDEWRSVRTDLINRPGCFGLALGRNDRLRVLPFTGRGRGGARVAFHPVRYSYGNGSYRPYAPDDRDGNAATVTLVLSLSAVNGAPEPVMARRPRNKRATVRNAVR